MEANRNLQPRPVSDIQIKCVFDDDRLKKHIKSAVRRGLPQVEPRAENNLTAVLCGSGPSLRDFTAKIQEHKDKGDTVVAIKGAHDFLINQGVIPHYGLAIDPQPKIYHTFTPHKDVRYFLASQVHPSVFNKLREQEITLFHLYTNIPHEEMQRLIGDGFLLGGGSTSGLRAMTLMFVLGYRKFHLYGFDSCMKEGIRKITGEGQQHKKVVTVHVGSPDSTETYEADLAMAGQAEEFEKMVGFLGNMSPVHFTTHGYGLIPAIARFRQNRGDKFCSHED